MHILSNYDTTISKMTLTLIFEGFLTFIVTNIILYKATMANIMISFSQPILLLGKTIYDYAQKLKCLFT